MKKQNGSHLSIIIVVIAVLGIGIFIAWRVLTNTAAPDGQSTNTQTPPTQTSTLPIKWGWDGQNWAANATPPACKEPLAFTQAPSDLKKATSVLYPGQTRGGDYKPHGGFRFDGSTNNIEVRAIYDGQLVEGSRYIESGEVQYMFTIQNDCGLAYRFDHLLTLAPAIQEQANKLPEAKPDDSRTTNFDQPLKIKAGDVIATAVGHKAPLNVGYDLGVYDLRKRNAAAADSAFIFLHQDELAHAAYALCWFDMFPKADADRIKSLPAADQASGKTSDYCK